ncbi:response regulator [Croceibacterium ferulae]|uniref:response regulator n=1 Tax=Croceibacterium ferulae TaxID=1854641 RepID=UPI000EB4A686|nr:response regulator [Croceibacterium ferulae]
MPPETIRILAVDDVAANLAALQAALDLPGVEMVQAGGAIEALELLLHGDFALALLDVQMPEMDGFELAELMRSTERTRGIPIIFLTAVATDEQRRFQGFEAGGVDYLLKPLDITVLRSKVSVFVELARQRRELARQRDELGAALGRLRAHGDNSPLAVIELDADGRIITWAEGAVRLFGLDAGAMLGTRIADAAFLPADMRTSFMTAIADLLAEGDCREMQCHRFIRADGAVGHGEWYYSSLSGKAGPTRTLMLQVQDVTERHLAEETQRLLVGELNHRVKNTLATVQAMASLSLKRARSLPQFEENFTGRLQSMSRAHALLSATTWSSASLRRLIADQLAIGTVPEERLRLEGADVHLPPELALRFALVLHELATNAHKYGALSGAAGQVAVSWHIADGTLHFCWSESGGPLIEAVDRRGFGFELITGSLRPSGGRADVDVHREGLTWRIAMPVEEADQPAPAVEQQTQPVAPASSLAGSARRLSRVLIVEDEPLVAMELALELEDLGLVTLGPATSCRQALDLLAAEAPDAVLLDGNLNGEPVIPVAEALAQSGTPFAFVTGYSMEQFPAEFRDRPILSKPFTGADLRRILALLEGEPVTATVA